MFHFWSEDNKWLRNKKWSFIIKSSRVKYTRILDPQIPFWCQRSQRIFSFQTFLCSGEIEFLREGENCFLFNFLRAETRPGPAFPQLQETEASEQPPPLAACAHYASSWLVTVRRFSSDCLSHLWSKSSCIIIRVPVASCLIGVGCLSTPNKTSTNFFPFVTSALISLCFVAASIRFFTEKMS